MAETMRAAHDALHTPVMLRQCLDLLAPALSESAHPDEPVTLVDCTLGMGGHTEAFLREFPHISVIGIDRDPQAIELASERLAPYSDRFEAVHATYDQVQEIVEARRASGRVSAVLMDLGMSSLQIDQRERGFSYSHDAPLDMRMNPEAPVSAADLVAHESQESLEKILRVYGEERFARAIARAIVAARETNPIRTTGELAALVQSVIPAAARRKGGNPSKRTFQALRIAVNEELDILEAALPAAIAVLRIGGRLAVESYHSLEDRLVKQAFARGTQSRTPPGLPVDLPEYAPYLASLTRGAMKAPEEEVDENSRAASVRLRAVERTRDQGAVK